MNNKKHTLGGGGTSHNKVSLIRTVALSIAVVAIVCCNLLLGYTLLKVDATDGNPVVNPSPVILGGAPAEYTGVAQKIVTNLPAGMRYAISTEYIDPAKIDAGKIVPTGYTALDYLESTGTQYIDTGVFPDSNTQVDVSFMLSTASTADACLFGSRTTITNENGILAWANNQNNEPHAVLVYSKTNSTPVLFILGSNVVQSISLGPDGGFINGTKVLDTSGANFAVPYSMLLCGVRTATTDNDIGYYDDLRRFYGRIYSCEIYQESKLVRDFVPVRGADGKLGMYDLVESKLYTNDGTGDDFIAGEAVNMNAGKLAYTENWADSIDDPANQMVLAANTKYYVYYYTANTDSTTVNAVSVKEFTVECNTHVFGEWQETTAATCTTDGERQHICEGCGHTETEVIPAIGHNYEQSFDQSTGNTTFTCTICGDHYSYACTDHEHGHHFVDTVIDPDCESLGYTTHICEHCQYTYQDNYLPATGHSYGEWVTIEPPTANQVGIQRRTCHCGATQERTLAALGVSTPSSDKDGNTPLIVGVIIGVIAVLAGCGGLAWLLLVVSKTRRQKKGLAAA